MREDEYWSDGKDLHRSFSRVATFDDADIARVVASILNEVRDELLHSDRRAELFPETASLRDRFAMAVLAGAMANPLEVDDGDTMADVTADCYRWADAMMEARKR